MIYFDTTYLVRLYFKEPGFAAVRALAATDQIACLVQGQVEVISAFHRKLREQVIGAGDFLKLVDQFRIHADGEAITWLPQRPEIINGTLAIYSRLPSSVFLRAADALHLATAAEHGFKTVYSNDIHLLRAAKYFGLKAANVL